MGCHSIVGLPPTLNLSIISWFSCDIATKFNYINKGFLKFQLLLFVSSIMGVRSIVIWISQDWFQTSMPIYVLGWRERLWEWTVLPTNTTRWPRSGIEHNKNSGVQHTTHFVIASLKWHTNIHVSLCSTYKFTSFLKNFLAMKGREKYIFSAKARRESVIRSDDHGVLDTSGNLLVSFSFSWM